MDNISSTAQSFSDYMTRNYPYQSWYTHWVTETSDHTELISDHAQAHGLVPAKQVCAYCGRSTRRDVDDCPTCNAPL